MGSDWDIGVFPNDVRSTPTSGHCAVRTERPKCANNRLMHRNKQRSYSITSSARASSVGGTVIPIERAVPRFMASLIRVGS
jgi:hypothetical protein